MSSRRTRLKAVINLPIRRGQEDERSPITKALVEQKGYSPMKTQTPVTYISDIVTAPTKEYPVDLNTHESVYIDADGSLSTSVASDQSKICTVQENSAPKNEVPLSPKVTLQARKRLKPTVSLLAVSRKSKERDVELEPVTQIPQQANAIVESIADQNSVMLKTLPDSLCSNLSSSRVHTGDDNTNETHHSFSKVPSKPKFVKLAPRLVGGSARRTSLSYISEAENHLKLSHSLVGQKVLESTATTSLCQPAFQLNSESDEVVEKSLSSSDSPKPSLFVDKHSKQPSETLTARGDVELHDDQTSKTEKRIQTHRRPRKNGPGEILSIARRDFYKKFGTSTPDKKKLTMFDLIFYNPTTNPMKFDKSKSPLSKLSIERSLLEGEINAERIEEENVDDVTPFVNEKDVPMPAPQVKVGPDGSLIIDEKSLVIETTGSRQRKDELANSSIVEDYGTGSATYNSFTRKVKPKEWSKEETFKFYRALHSVGTDFLLMQSIFPNRTRADLKLKYKKEDRQNRDLVDKALQNPLEFDLSHLEKELEQEGKENKQHEEKIHEERKKKSKKHPKGGRWKSHVAAAIMEGSRTTHAVNKLKSIEKKYVTPCNQGEDSSHLPPKKRKVSYKCSDSSSTSEDEDNLAYLNNANEDETKQDTRVIENSEEDNSSDDDFDNRDFLPAPRSTRSGRLSHTRMSLDDASVVTNSRMEILKKTSMCIDSTVHSVGNSAISQPTQLPINIPSLQNVEPGSLVILSTPGQNTLQLFMVAPRGGSGMSASITHIPVAITPEILESVSSSIDELRSSEPPSSDEAIIAIDEHDM